jgi:hypothetical protein
LSKNRHDFKESDKKLLAERVGFHCSNPSCGVATVGPSDIPTDKEYIGVAAHIYSASIDNGPRANPSLSETERSSIENGIHLCNKCSTIIDKNNGDGYPAELLKHWKRSAEAAARERIYTNSPINIYSLIKFNNLEQQYSTALTCTGLNEKNIISCPENKEIIDETIIKLNLANKCILSGPSGCGKSLLTYQISYRYYKKGWNIYKINKESITNKTDLVAPKEKSFIIIDDIQTIPPQHIENLLCASYQECKILGNYNSDTNVGEELIRRYPNVQIILSTQIAVLKEYCLKNKDLLSQKLQSLGLNTHNNSYHDCIETRIERASREKTPWLFNYNLTEGWNSAKQDLKFLKENDIQHLVIITVAIFQLATLDLGVADEIIISALKKYKKDIDWISKVKRTLKEKCLTNDDVIRNKHYEYSRKILRIFVDEKESKAEKLFLINLIKDILYSNKYIAGHSNILEFISFDFKWCEYLLKKERVYLDLGEKIIKINTPPSYSVINKFNSLLRSDPEVIQLIITQMGTIENWLTLCTKDTAYSLGNLLNTLHNQKIDKLKTGKKIFILLFDLMRKAEIEDYSRFSYVINRLGLLLEEEDIKDAKTKLEESDFSVSVTGYSAGMNCFHFSSVIKDFMYISKKWADNQVSANIKGIAYLFNNDFKNALDYFKELIFNYFGIIAAILGSYKTTGNIKKNGKELASYLAEQSIILGFNEIKASEVQQYGDILIFLALYDIPKLMSISDKFNYNRLQTLFSGYSKIDHYHRALVHILRNVDSKNWKNHVYWLITSVQYVERQFFFLDSELSFYRIKKNVHYEINIHMCSDCKEELIVLKAIQEELGNNILSKVILDNTDSLAKAICTKYQNGDDHKSKFDLLVFILQNQESIYSEIFSIEDHCKDIISKLERLLHGKKWEKMHAKLYAFLLRKYSYAKIDELTAIEKRFSSLKNFKIEDYLGKDKVRDS